MDDKWIEEQVKVDPKGTIKTLLEQQARQAKSIHDKTERIKALEKEVAKLSKRETAWYNKASRDQTDFE